MIKAIFFDIDGTLVSFKTHQIPQSTLFALSELRKKGIKIFISTGRSWGQMQHLNDFPQFDGYITLNGSCCMDGNGSIIHQVCIPTKDLELLVQYLHTNNFPIEVVYADQEVMTSSNEVVERAWANVNMPVPPIIPLHECNLNEVYQLGAFLNSEEQEALKITERFMPSCAELRWSPDFFDILPRESSKSAGIDRIIEHYGISIEETMAFGDGGNDIDMLQHAAIGVAMGNAGDNVKAAADHITTSVDDDGILNALKKFNILS
jgi:Cof subfamily protein (haloacid dehalogenase superfamily)